MLAVFAGCATPTDADDSAASTSQAQTVSIISAPGSPAPTGPFLGVKISVFNAGGWYIDNDQNGFWGGTGVGMDRLDWFGSKGDQPVRVLAVPGGAPRDVDAVFNAGSWYIDSNGNGTWDGTGAGKDSIGTFGAAGDVAVTGNWSATSLGTFSAGRWQIDKNGNGKWDDVAGGDALYWFGSAGDIPVVGDWDGTGVSKIGVFNAGAWYIDANGNGSWDGPNGGDAIYYFGQAGDLPVTGDWAAKGKSALGVFRAGKWWIDWNANGIWDGADYIATYGSPGDIPVVGWPASRLLTPYVAWGTDDTSPIDRIAQMKRDVTVKIHDSVVVNGINPECSGTLITPQIVITASHCLRGGLASQTSFVENTPQVMIGANPDVSANPITTAIDALPYINRQVNNKSMYETSTDVAIVYLPAGIASGNTHFGNASPADFAWPTRPSFAHPSWTTVQMAGYAPENLGSSHVRQVATTDIESWDSVYDAAYFTTWGAAARGGDSGGSLFEPRNDGTRDLIGVISENDSNWFSDPSGHTSYSADITTPLLMTWIRTNVQDTFFRTHHGQQARSAGWFAQHQKDANDYWFGELDYVGPCQTASDSDCDHWYNGHDNCPYRWNVDQEESTTSPGFGQVCEPPPPPHVAPQNLIVQTATDPTTQLYIGWQETSSRVDSYDIVKNGVVSTTVPGGQNSYNVLLSALQPGTTYTFLICSSVGTERLCSAPIHGSTAFSSSPRQCIPGAPDCNTP